MFMQVLAQKMQTLFKSFGITAKYAIVWLHLNVICERVIHKS